MTPVEDDPHPEVIGQTFGKVTVVAFKGFKYPRGVKYPAYEIKCICGTKRTSYYSNLKWKGSEPCITCQDRKKKLAEKMASRSYKIRERASKLRKERLADRAKARSQVAKTYKVDIEHATRMLLNDREYARTGKLLYEDGRPDESAPDKAKLDPRAAVQATMAIASLHGLVTKRSEITISGAIEVMKDDELIDFIDKVKAKLEHYETIDLNAAPDRPLIEQPVPEVIGYEDDDADEG